MFSYHYFYLTNSCSNLPFTSYLLILMLSGLIVLFRIAGPCVTRGLRGVATILLGSTLE